MKTTQCPCDRCVTCSCAASPNMDDDGLCASCGGQSYVLAAICGEPHIGTEVGQVDYSKIAVIIAASNATQEAVLVRAAQALLGSGEATDQEQLELASRIELLAEGIYGERADATRGRLAEIIAMSAGFFRLRADDAKTAVAERIHDIACGLLVEGLR